MHTHSLRPLLALGLLAAVGCPGKEPSEPTPKDDAPWAYRWQGTFTAHLADGAVSDAYSACERLSTATDGAWGGEVLFTLELNTDGLYRPHNDSRALETIQQDERGRYCRIQPLTTDAENLEDIEWKALSTFLQATGGTAVPDLPTVVPMGLADTAADTLSLVGATEPLLADASLPLVHVVVADTEPTGTYDPTVAATTEHGGATARIVYSLLCETNTGGNDNDSSSCGVSVSTQHAMPYQLDAATQRSIIDPTSGQYGTHHSLAQAIDRATRAHVTSPMPTLLNLSLGWNAGHAVEVDFVSLTGLSARDRRELMQDPTLQPAAVLGSWDRDPSKLTASERAVYEALVRARCAGILPLASAGNRTNLPDPQPRVQEGPLLPAAWMVQENDTASDVCAEHGYPNLGWTPGAPLVYAVSGVDRQGRALGLVRPEANAPFAALGLGVTVPDATRPEEPFYLVSGTSASAGVTTAALAGAWAMDPTLSGDAVAYAVYSSGVDATEADGTTPVVADFGQVDRQTDTRIVQLCAAAQAIDPSLACTTGSVSLGSTGAPGSVAASPRTPADCDDAATAAAAPCSARYEPTPEALRDVWPQPPTDTCPPCNLEIVSAPSADLEAVFTFKTTEATPFWQKATFTATNNITAYHLELQPLIGAPQVVTYRSPADLALFGAPNTELEVALTRSMNVYSATLVLEGTNLLTGRGKSWNVPLTLITP